MLQLGNMSSEAKLKRFKKYLQNAEEELEFREDRLGIWSSDDEYMIMNLMDQIKHYREEIQKIELELTNEKSKEI